MGKKPKKILKTLKSKTKNILKSKIKSNSTFKKKDKRKIIKTFYDKNEYITDLSFIDKFEEDEKERIKIKENETLIKILNKKIYTLKICYRPLTNNIELIGTYLQYEEINKNKENILDNNKCSYLLFQDNNIIAPILNEDILNLDKQKNKGKIINKINEGEIKENTGKQKHKKKHKNKNKQYFYVHICKNNLIKCLLLNEYSLINYILLFLSGIYSGYFEVKNKNNTSILKNDLFRLFLNVNNKINNAELYNIDVFGKGKDEYGEYTIKGKMNLINNIEQYQQENQNIKINIKNSNKIIYFGNILFHKNYNI